MRHEQISNRSSYTMVDVAAVWPTTAPIAPPAIAEPMTERAPMEPTPAAPDMPAAVGGMIVAAFVSLIAAFALATVGSAGSIFAITIAALFLVAFFAVPRIFLAVEPKHGPRPSLARFLAEGMDTLTGHSSGRAALVQILVVPVLLTIGALAMGVIASFVF